MRVRQSERKLKMQTRFGVNVFKTKEDDDDYIDEKMAF